MNTRNELDKAQLVRDWLAVILQGSRDYRNVAMIKRWDNEQEMQKRLNVLGGIEFYCRCIDPGIEAYLAVEAPKVVWPQYTELHVFGDNVYAWIYRAIQVLAKKNHDYINGEDLLLNERPMIWEHYGLIRMQSFIEGRFERVGENHHWEWPEKPKKQDPLIQELKRIHRVVSIHPPSQIVELSEQRKCKTQFVRIAESLGILEVDAKGFYSASKSFDSSL